MRTRRLWVAGIAVLLAIAGTGWEVPGQTEAQICGGDCGANGNRLLLKELKSENKCAARLRANPAFDALACETDAINKCWDKATPWSFRYPTCCCPSATNIAGCVTNNDSAFDCATLPATPYKFIVDCGYL